MVVAIDEKACRHRTDDRSYEERASAGKKSTQGNLRRRNQCALERGRAELWQVAGVGRAFLALFQRRLNNVKYLRRTVNALVYES
jgi:hypothetical protein